MKRAASYCDDIEFSPEDAARTEIDFLCQVVEAAIDAGATTVNIPGHGRLRHAGSYGKRHQVAHESRAEHRQGA